MTNSNTDKIFLRTVAAILRDAAPHNVNQSPLLMQMLIYIALHPGCCTNQLKYEFGVNQATISRNSLALRDASYWGRRPNRKKALIKLIPHSGRIHLHELTELGERYVARLSRRIADAATAVLQSHS